MGRASGLLTAMARTFDDPFSPPTRYFKFAARNLKRPPAKRPATPRLKINR
jgi:hypothetical protein